MSELSTGRHHSAAASSCSCREAPLADTHPDLLQRSLSDGIVPAQVWRAPRGVGWAFATAPSLNQGAQRYGRPMDAATKSKMSLRG
jgi:hypothetical protein